MAYEKGRGEEGGGKEGVEGEGMEWAWREEGEGMERTREGVERGGGDGGRRGWSESVGEVVG